MKKKVQIARGSKSRKWAWYLSPRFSYSLSLLPPPPPPPPASPPCSIRRSLWPVAISLSLPLPPPRIHHPPRPSSPPCLLSASSGREGEGEGGEASPDLISLAFVGRRGGERRPGWCLPLEEACVRACLCVSVCVCVCGLRRWTPSSPHPHR
jgi:hypothetical protein